MVTGLGSNQSENANSCGITCAFELSSALHSTSCLNDERHECLHPFLIIRIFVGEMPQHEPFFLFELDPKANANHPQTQEATEPADFDARAETHHQQTRVDGMPHEPVRPGLHQFVALLECDITTPVPSERPARPYRHVQPAHANYDTDDPRPIPARHQHQIHGGRQSLIRQQKPTQSHGNPMCHGGQQALRFRRPLYRMRADKPVDEKDDPASEDD